MTYQQEQHELRESQRRHIASQLLKPKMARAIERRSVLIRGNVDSFANEEPPTKREGSDSSWPAPARGADDVLRGAI